jgi:alpha-galactosidase
MNRKNFIVNTGVSLAGVLLIPEICFGKETAASILRFPSTVTALVNNKSVQLISSDKQTWAFENLHVKILKTPDGLSVDIEAPNCSLFEVKLHWVHSQTTSTRILNDHWERNYGDTSWHLFKPEENLPWYFMEFDGKITNGFGVKTGAHSFAYWQLTNKNLTLTLDTRCGGSGVNLAGRTLRAAEIITRKGRPGENSFQSLRKFCRQLCAKPRMPKAPVYGINDWYFSYGNNSDKLIIEHTNLLIKETANLTNRPFSVIDAGWFETRPDAADDCCRGDNMSNPNKKFKDMGKLASSIRDIGMRPGIWTRPLCASYKDAASLLLPDIEGRVNAKQPVLDPSVPENIERIKSFFKLYKQWGYEMVKFDFTSFDIFGKWGFQMAAAMSAENWKMQDDSKTNAEIILNLYQAIREASDDMYIIGCNTISHLSAGLFELNRIGDDTSGREWARTKKMGVNTLAFRGAQHGTFYSADADCVGLTNKIPWEKNKQWMQLLAESGTPLFISAQPDATGPQQKEFIKKWFSIASSAIPVGEPLDWMENAFPKKWKLNGKIVRFEWD